MRCISFSGARSPWAAGLCFFRFWKVTKDRLFLFLGSAFWVLVLNWTGLAIVPREDETRHYVFLLRLAAFVLIIVGIVDKNRRARAEAE